MLPIPGSLEDIGISSESGNTVESTTESPEVGATDHKDAVDENRIMKSEKHWISKNRPKLNSSKTSQKDVPISSSIKSNCPRSRKRRFLNQADPLSKRLKASLEKCQELSADQKDVLEQLNILVNVETQKRFLDMIGRAMTSAERNCWEKIFWVAQR